MKIDLKFLLVAAIMIAGFSALSFADTVITTTHAPYFHTGAGPIASIFYWIGDVIVLPFRLIGDLFS